MSEIIKLTDELRIRRVNALNVIVEKHVHNDETNADTWREYNGAGRGPFCQTEADACVWVLKHGLVDEGGETDLRGAIKQYDASAKMLKRAVAKAVEE